MLLHYDEDSGAISSLDIYDRTWLGYKTHPLPPDHPLKSARILSEAEQQALAIGQRVLNELEKHPEFELRKEACPGALTHLYDNNVTSHIALFVQRKSLKGLEWLKSLPVGTRILCGRDGNKWIVIRGGMQRIDYHTQQMFFNASHTMDKRWVPGACPETCPEWEPEGSKWVPNNE